MSDTTNTTTPGISVCMIVRDETENLPRCLSSVRSLADEIVVVDTGSTDDTVEIAERFKARVFHSPWRDDFSFHRNESLSHAAGDWILVIDADEELETDGSTDRIREALTKIDAHAAAVHILDVRDDVVVSVMNSPRFFQKGRAKYEGIVHNQPVIDGNEAVFLPGVRIRHYGYGLSREKMKAKYLRTVPLLKKQIEAGHAGAWFYLAEQHGMMDEWPDCLDACRRYIVLEKEMDGKFNGSVYFLAGQAAEMLGRRDEARSYFVTGLFRYPEDGDLGFALSEWGVRHGDREAVDRGALVHVRACRTFDKNPVLTGNRFSFTMRKDAYNLSLYRLAMVGLRRGVDAWRELSTRMHEGDKWGVSSEMHKNIKEESSRNFIEMGICINEPPEVSAAGN